jgi:hypothetical protein
MNILKFSQALFIIGCVLPPFILGIYTCYRYGVLVGYRLAVEDRNKKTANNKHTMDANK